MKKVLFISLFVLLILASPVFAKQGHTTLLTVSESAENVSVGGVADLYLEIRPGSSRVFIDSFPLTRLDTQITTRYSKEVACNFLDMDCSGLDFYYTIRAQTSLIGGPSAGAAKTLLTVALLDNQKISDSVVMTGTINSGGIIGSVSGVPDKIVAARNAGFDTIIVPRWTPDLDTDVEGIDVIPVSTLEEALFYFTGKDYSKEEVELVIPEDYLFIMGSISDELCDRTIELSQMTDSVNVTRNLERAEEAYGRGDYYSAASFCFTSNVDLRTTLMSNYSEDKINAKREELLVKIEEHENFVDEFPINTMSDLEASIIVKERLLEARNVLEETERVGYAEERFESALAWSKFFEFEGEAVDLDQDFLRNACLSKISEVEERVNYIDFITGVSQQRDSVDELRDIYRDEDYAFCIFRGTRIKADINAGLLSSSIESDSLNNLSADKIRIAHNQISHQDLYFPILGYSYYTYANALVDDDPRLSLIFSEYASEFSNLDMYLEGDRSIPWSIWISELNDARFYLGFSLGAGLVLFFALLSLRKKDFKPRKTSRRNPPGKKR